MYPFDKCNSLKKYTYIKHTVNKVFFIKYHSQSTRGWLTILLHESLQHSISPFLHASSWIKGGKYMIADVSYKEQSFSMCLGGAQCYPTLHLTVISRAHFKEGIPIFLPLLSHFGLHRASRQPSYHHYPLPFVLPIHSLAPSFLVFSHLYFPLLVSSRKRLEFRVGRFE